MDISREIVKRLRENRLLAESAEYEKMDHKDLVMLAKDGDQLAVNTLVKAYDPAISKVASKYIFDSGDREDAKQIALIGFWDAIQSWSGSGSFISYATRIMDRKLTDQLRKDSAGKELIHSQAASMDAPVASDDEGGEMTLGSSLPSRDLSPEEQYLGNEGARKIMKFMKEELSEVERKVIMKYIDGYKVSEISEEEGMKYKAVENALKRVKDKLAEYLRNVRESRKPELNESIFSDEEKQILRSILTKITDGVELNESSEDDYENLTDEEIEETINEINYKVDNILRKLPTDEEEANSIYRELESMESEILSLEDLIDGEDNNYLFQSCKGAYRMIQYAKNDLYDNVKKVDPYSSRGLSRSDFY